MSTYNGLSVAMRRPFSRGLLVAANYMWSHEIDNGSNGSGDGDEIQSQNPLCQACDSASGAWDARNVVNGNAVYQLPFGLGKPMLNQHGIVSAIAGNWELTTIALARTGFPVNVLMPRATSRRTATMPARSVPIWFRAFRSLRREAKRVAEWINPAAFAYPGPVQQSSDSALHRATWFAGRAHGRSIWAPARRFTCGSSGAAGIPLGVLQRLQSPAVGSAGDNVRRYRLNLRSDAVCVKAGLGQIASPINLNTAIVSPITPVGSGTPREMQFALRLEF